MTMTKITTMTTKSTELPCRRAKLLLVVVLTWTTMVMASTASASESVATASLPSFRFRGGSSGHVAAAAAAATTTATLLHQHQRRQLMEEREDDDDDDDEDDDDDDSPRVEETAFPTAGPTAQTTMAPTVSTTNAPTTATTTPTTSPTTEQPPVTLELLPFALTVLDQRQPQPRDEPQVRQDLQEYLFVFMDDHLQQQNTITGSSVRLLGIELQLDEGSGVEDDGGRARRLQLRLRRQRKLQDEEAEAAVFQDQEESTTDTAAPTTTEWTYRGVAVLAPSSTTLDAALDLDFATIAQIQQAQISALEDDNALQTYFLDQYRESVEAGLNQGEGDEYQDPLLLTQVQVDDRVPIALDPEAALQELEEQAEDGEIGGTVREDPEEENNAPQDPNDNAIQDNGGDRTDNNGKGWLVGVIVGALLIVAGFIGTFLFVRKGRHERKKSFVPDKLEVISEAGSDDGVEAIYNKAKGILAVGTQSTDDDDASENPTGSPVSTSKQANEEDEDGMEDGDPKRRLFFSWGGRGKKKEDVSLYAGSSIDHILDDFEGGTEIVPSRKERDTIPVIDLTRPSENSFVRSFSNGWGGWTQQAETPKPGTSPGSAAAIALRKLSSYGRERTPPISNRDVKELDGIVDNVQNLTSYDDEESMAGYSLASEDSKPKKKTNAQHNNTAQTSSKETANENEADAASVASSEASGVQLNPLFAGVQNLLQNPERSQSNLAPQNRRNFGILNRLRKKQQTEDFASSSDSESSVSELNNSFATEGALEVVASPDQTRIYVDGEAGKVPVFTNRWTEDDDASLLTKDDDSIYKEDDSVKGGESLSGYSASQVSDSDNFIFDTTKIGGPSPLSTLGYFERGDDAEDGMLFPDITPAPSEEMQEILDITRNPMYTKSILDSGVATGDSDDEHSDAPSDELGFGNSTKLATVVNTTSSTLDISLDSDPAVVDYLMKERRSTRRFARKKREDRRQPPVTMEV